MAEIILSFIKIMDIKVVKTFKVFYRLNTILYKFLKKSLNIKSQIDLGFKNIARK